MSAMPERVWVSIERDGVLYAWYEEGIAGDVPYVPESRLLAAEARVREVEAERDAWSVEAFEKIESGKAHVIYCNGDHRIPLWDVRDGVLCNCPIGQHFKKLHREVATLRAERDALVAEVARYKELLLTMEMPDA